MECPFYMLDEFDVFMDAFNRKASQQALIAHAKLFKFNQFFLFSPLDLVEVPGESEATVIR
jgi:chromosome segregation ATPase